MPIDLDELEAALLQLNKRNEDKAKARIEAHKILMETWWETLQIDILGAQTRETALDNYNQVVSLIAKEQDQGKKNYLTSKLIQCNLKFKEIKRNEL